MRRGSEVPLAGANAATDPEAGWEDDHKYRKSRDERCAWRLAAIAIFAICGLVILPISSRYDLLLMLIPRSYKRIQLSAAEADAMVKDHTFLFIGGPHRGGTTLLWRLLRLHPQVGAFDQMTDSDFSEGAFLQSVLPTFGVGREAEDCRRGGSVHHERGIGRYGFGRRAHMTEGSRLSSRASRDTLLAEWGYYWGQGLRRLVLLEKTPTNLMTSRLLQSLFAPRASFLFVSRHPLAVVLAERALTSCSASRHSGEDVGQGLLHWTLTHTALQRDLHRLASYRVIRYEDLVDAPAACMAEVGEWMRAPRAGGGGGGVAVLPGAAAEWLRAVKAEPVSSSTNRKYETAYCERELETAPQRRRHCQVAAALQPKIDLLGLGYDVMQGGHRGFACVGARVSCAAEGEGEAVEVWRRSLRKSLDAYEEPVARESGGRQLGGEQLLCGAGYGATETASQG